MTPMPQRFEGKKDSGTITRSGLVAGKAAIQVIIQIPGDTFCRELVHDDVGRTRLVR